MEQQPTSITGELNRLNSWKEIGAYLERDARTAQRWEKEEGLPVHRHSHKSRSTVYAYPSEIDAWRAGRRVPAEPVPARAFWRWPAFAATTVLCLIMVGNGVRPVSAQQTGGAKAARQIWQTQPLQYPNAISPDGHYVAVTDWNTGDLWLRDLTTGTNRRLTDYGDLAHGWQYVNDAVFSQDSTQIAYSWSIDKELINELRVIPVSGGTPRTVRRSETHGDYMLPLGWSPDKKWMLVRRQPGDNTTQLAMVSVQDGSVRPLKSFGWQRVNASLSPDGRWVAYDAHPNDKTLSHDIFVLAVDGSHESAVVQNPADDVMPVWTPDGKRILFLTDRTGQRSIWSVPVADGKPGNPELVKPDIGRDGLMQTGRDGTLYYRVPGGAKSNLYVAELDASQKVSRPPALAVESFVNANSGATVSPDGERLAYRSVRAGTKATLVVRTLKTGEERTIPLKPPFSDSVGGLVNWFPDGRSLLVFERLAEGPGDGFYRVDLETGQAELLHSRRGTTGRPQLSPNGKFIVYAEDNSAETAPRITNRLVRFDLDSRRETELKKGEWIMGVGISPDSKQISYLVSGLTGEAFLAVMPATGGVARTIYRASPWDGYSRSIQQVWTPDQQHLLFVKPANGASGTLSALWRVPVSGGEAEQIGISMYAQLRFSMPADGKRLFVSANEEGRNEVWALENFLTKTESVK